MTKPLPRVAVPGGAATAPVRRAHAPGPGGRSPRQSRRISRSSAHAVFVRNVPGHGPEERLLAREIAWCETHCAGYWALHFALAAGGERAAHLSFTDAADAAAFRAWLTDLDPEFPCPQATAS